MVQHRCPAVEPESAWGYAIQPVTRPTPDVRHREDDDQVFLNVVREGERKPIEDVPPDAQSLSAASGNQLPGSRIRFDRVERMQYGVVERFRSERASRFVPSDNGCVLEPSFRVKDEHYPLERRRF